jgi:Tfp pilus assembly protein PilF
MAVAYHSPSGDAGQNERLAWPASGEPGLPRPPTKKPEFEAEPSAVAPDATTARNVPVDRFEARFGPEIAGLLRDGSEALAAGSADSAIVHFRNAVQADRQNPQIPVDAAVLALEQNHPTLAVDLLKPAAERFSKSAAVHLTLGAAYYRLGDYPSSQVALRQALSLDNSNGLAYLLMGCTLEKLGQPEAALVQWERAAAVCPRYRHMRR